MLLIQICAFIYITYIRQRCWFSFRAGSGIRLLLLFLSVEGELCIYIYIYIPILILSTTPNTNTSTNTNLIIILSTILLSILYSLFSLYSYTLLLQQLLGLNVLLI